MIAFHDTAATAAQNVDSSSYVVTLPTYTAGDIVFIHLANTNRTGATDTTFSASGWTVLDVGRAHSNAFNRSAVLWRVMDGSEGTTVTVTFGGTASGTNHTVGQATSYSGGGGLDGAAVVGTSFSFVGSLSLSKTTTGPNEEAVEFVAYIDPLATSFTPSTGTERYDRGPFTLDVTVGWHLENNDKAAATAGSYTLAGTFSDTSQYRAVMAAITLAPTTNIKTVEGLAKPGIKTVMGAPIASIKTIEGLA